MEINAQFEALDYWESAKMVFPDETKIASLLKKEKWPKKAGAYVARVDVQYNAGPAVEGGDNDDKYAKALIEAGYKIDVWPDFTNDDALEYYIYEMAEEDEE